jgi:O-antigen/teichoic acid export membrane protein
MAAVTKKTDTLLRRPAAEAVGSLARRGAMWTFGLIVSRHAVTLGATAILARILSPTDYGLMGMVMTLTAFFQVFSDMGLSWATVQRREITRAQVDNLFWVNAVFGALLWVACTAAGPMLNRFYGRSELAGIAAVMGAGFLLSSLTVQPTALLRRQMRLKVLCKAEMAAHLAGAAAGVALALLGFGYWALVGQSLVMQAGLLASLFWVTSYRPGLPAKGQGTLSLISFGGYVAAFYIVNYFTRTLDNILVGKVWGAEELGYYSRAYFLMMLPATLATSSLAGVMVPALSALRGNRMRFESAYRKAAAVSGFLGFPLAVGLGVTAHEVIYAVFGSRWTPVTPILVWLSVAAVSQPVYTTMWWLFMATGKGRELLQLGVATAITVSAAVLIGVRWGALGVAIAIGFTLTFVVAGPALLYAHRAAGLSFRETTRLLQPMFWASLAMGGCAYLAGRGAAGMGCTWLVVLTVKIAAGTLGYPLFLQLFRGHRNPMRPLHAEYLRCRDRGIGEALPGLHRLAGLA